MTDPIRTGEPHNALTQLADDISKAADSDPRFEGVRYILMLDDGEMGAVKFHGYDDRDQEGRADLLTDLLQHTEAVFKSLGVPFGVAAIPFGPDDSKN